MIKENQKAFIALHVISDSVLLVCSVLLAHALRFLIFRGVDTQGMGYYSLMSLFVTVLFLFLYGMFGLYEYSPTRSVNLTKELEKVFASNLIGTAVLLATLFVLRNVDVSRWLLVFFAGISTMLISINRFVMRRLLRYYQRQGYHQRRVLIVGSNETAKRYYNSISNNKNFGMLPVGQIANGNGTFLGLRRLGGFDKLAETLEQNQVDEVVAALSLEENAYISQVIQDCEKHGVKLSLIPFYADLISAHPYIDEVDGLPLMNIRRIPLDNWVNAFMKRTVDIVGALILILLSSPFMLIAAIGTKLSSPGPIIFKQVRVGRNKQEFVMYKFRSMRVNDREDTGWSRDSDPRKTKFGSFIRKCSIDELPQFFNVLKGDMSLVGPRPEVPHFVNQFKETVPLYMVKHQVRPGITGWAQVNGLRGDTSIEDRIDCDLFYIENWSLLLDIKILFMTVTKALVNSEKLA